jgi:hypothetical protein
MPGLTRYLFQPDSEIRRKPRGLSSKFGAVPNGAKLSPTPSSLRAKRSNLSEQNQSFRDCRVADTPRNDGLNLVPFGAVPEMDCGSGAAMTILSKWHSATTENTVHTLVRCNLASQHAKLVRLQFTQIAE